jgi:uncharacterized protein (TIGR02996 family)
LATVIAAPDQDAPRVAFASWCDSRGDSRGEFIRLQLRAANKIDPLDSEAAQAYWRSMDLLKLHAEKWMRFVRPYARGAQYYRGFVTLVSDSATEFLKDADALFRLAPIQHVDVVPPLDGRLSALLACPHLSKLRGLSLRGLKIGDAGACAVAACAGLAALRYLDLGLNDIGMDGVTALLESPHLNKLVIVPFDGNQVNLAYSVGIDQGVVVDSQPSPAATLLMQKYGRRLWLDHVDGDRFSVATWSAP